jgi:predicted transcriptional regulator
VKAEKRTRFHIYFDILRVLLEESKNDKTLSLTKAAHKANLPYDRFQEYLDELVRLGMISSMKKRAFFVTEKGLEYINEYRKIIDFLIRMGLLA